jgi:hypothetical protein
MGHGRRGIELGSPPERAHRFVMVEGVDQRQALIEEALRIRAARRDWVVQPAEARHQRGRLIGRRRVTVVRLLRPKRE